MMIFEEADGVMHTTRAQWHVVQGAIWNPFGRHQYATTWGRPHTRVAHAARVTSIDAKQITLAIHPRRVTPVARSP